MSYRHEEQIDYIDQKLKIGIRDKFKLLPSFLEMVERKDLFVKCGGLITQQYIDRCKAFKHADNTTVLDGQIKSDREYFKKSYELCFEIVLRIGQGTLRRLFPEQLYSIDRSLNHLAIRFLNIGDYSIAEIITDYDINLPDKFRSEDNEFPYFARINRASAQKFSGKDFEKGLVGVPWKVFHPKYKICLHALREEYKETSDMMRTEAIRETLGEDTFRTWPVFKEFRKTSFFREAYVDLFNKEYKPNLLEDIKTMREQQELNDV